MGSAFFTSRVGGQDRHRIRTQERFVFAQCVLAFRSWTATEPEIPSLIVGNTYVCSILLEHLASRLRIDRGQPYSEQDWLEDLELASASELCVVTFTYLFEPDRCLSFSEMVLF